jgi:GTPase SAR1 family protein
MTVKAVAFVAKSGSGKTTLLEKVIARLKDRGYRVGAIKHDAHRFDIDRPGKDSYRLTAAGADTMVISSGRGSPYRILHGCGYRPDRGVQIEFLAENRSTPKGTLCQPALPRQGTRPDAPCGSQ